jgi:hypothetical protein
VILVEHADPDGARWDSLLELLLAAGADAAAEDGRA